MAFTLRRPFAVTGALKQISKPAASSVRAAFHSTPIQASQQRLTQPAAGIFAKSGSTFRNAFRQQSKRGYQQAVPGVQTGNMTQRLLYGGAIFGGTLVAINLYVAHALLLTLALARLVTGD